MAKKNESKETVNRENEQREQAAEPKRANPYVEARIDRLIDYANSKVKASASASIGGAFAIHGIRVIESQNGLFVQMPQKSFQRDGNTEYRDIFHPITAEARSELYNKVLEAYEQKLAEAENEDEGETEEQDDESDFDEYAEEASGPVLGM
ncbi:MAG: SpoVG family protein [Clostridia bacterium]|nr:SpoVG family protein [Clostridia bacterium]